MRSKTKIIVLHMKEVIYTTIFIILGIVLIFLLIYMFGPGRHQKNGSNQPKYKAGVYTSFGGTFGNHVHKGNVVIPFIEDHDKLMKVCDAAIDFFADHANAGERFKFTIDRVGADKFEQAIREAYENE